MPGKRRPHVSEKTRGHARQLRREITPAEKRLWVRLRNQQLLGVKFRRQCPIGQYIVDFCCPTRRLIVEIDGDSHAETITHDAVRTRALEESGYRVIRFTNSEVHRSFKEVLEAILKECQR